MSVRYKIEPVSEYVKGVLEQNSYIRVSKQFPFRSEWDTVEYDGPSDLMLSQVLSECREIFELSNIKVLEAWHVLKVRIA
jgi:hypothetical protein